MIGFEVVALRVALAAVFGGVIGIEREWRHKAAGIKTNMLVAVGAVAFAMVSNTFGPANHNPAQIAAAVVTGIGFVGAGVIIHRGVSVQGVTTAATLWANAAMALSIGLGQYIVGAGVFAAILFVQFLMREAVEYIGKVRRRSSPRSIEIRIACNPATLAAVNQAWAEFTATAPVERTRSSVTRRAGSLFWKASFRSMPSHQINLQPLEAKLVALDGVRKVEMKVAEEDEDG